LIATFQNEWDAVMLETYTLKQQLESVRQELAHALYQHDAACRVIARLIKERDDSRNALANFRTNMQNAPASSSSTAEESMEVESQFSIPDSVRDKIIAKSQDLAKDRKKRQISSELASPSDIKGYKVLSTSPLHKTTTPGILSLDIHPNDATKVLTGGVDGDIVLFDRDTNKMGLKITGHKKGVNDLAFHPTAPLVLSASSDATAKIWTGSLENGFKVQHTISAHDGEVVGLSLQPTGDYVLTGSTEGLWAFSDIQTGTCLAKAQIGSSLSTVRFHPDGLLFGVATSDNGINIFDIKTQKNVANLEEHKGKVASVSFSENGYYVSSLGADNTVKLWDLRKLKAVQSYDLPSDFSGHSLNFDYSGSYIAVAGSDIRVLATKSFEVIGTYSQHKSEVTSVKWGPDARFFASGGMDRALKFWGTK